MMSRLDDLQEHIEKAFGYIVEHEQLMQTTQRPEERQNSEHWIRRHWRYIARWVAQAKTICSRIPDDYPPWLVEAEASLPAQIEGKTQVFLDARQQVRAANHLDVHPDYDKQRGVDADVSESIAEATKPHLPSPLMEESAMHRWDREMLEFAHIGVVLEKTKRVLRQRSVFRPGELREIGTSIEGAGRRASELKKMATDSEILLYPTLEPRALDDLRQIIELAERIVEALDNLDIEASLEEPPSHPWLEQAEQNMRALGHYIASVCDWMMLEQIGPSLDLSSDIL